MGLRRTVTIVLLSAALPAYANNPPAPQMGLGFIFIIPVMMILTAVAGGYALRRRLFATPNLPTRIGKVLGVLALIFFGLTHEGWGFLVLLLFAIVALFRAVQLIRWSIRPPVEGAPRGRLAVAGSLLLIIAIAAGGLAPAFIAIYPPANRNRVAALQNFVALEMAGDNLPPAVAAKRQEFERSLMERMQYYEYPDSDSRVIMQRSRGGFTLFMLPAEKRFPFFPYNFLMSAPSYRADQTGAIRMIYVHERNQRCPAGAPIVYQVSGGDLEAIRRGNVVPEWR